MKLSETRLRQIAEEVAQSDEFIGLDEGLYLSYALAVAKAAMRQADQASVSS